MFAYALSLVADKRIEGRIQQRSQRHVGKGDDCLLEMSERKGKNNLVDMASYSDSPTHLCLVAAINHKLRYT